MSTNAYIQSNLWEDLSGSYLKPNIIVPFVASLMAGLVASAIFYPLELVEAKLQLDQIPSVPKAEILPPVHKPVGKKLSAFPSIWRALKHVYRHNGFKGFFQGALPACGGYALSLAFSFYVMELLVDFAPKNNSLTASMNDLLTANILSNVAACLIYTPFSTLKMRLIGHKEYNNSMYEALSTIVLKEKASKLFSGLTLSVIGVWDPLIQYILYEGLNQLVDKDSSRLYLTVGIFLMATSTKLVSLVVTYPIQLVRNKIQSDNTGFFETIKLVLTNHGVFGLYQGLTVAILRQVPPNGAMFMLYEHFLRFFNSYIH
mmetsp:Transcript_47059/g.54242  ORF Transcript_47059/g.54242 Transcript_47059/m.54242 type:complete len:316 (-) Transcript_47059:379-1326(-)